MFDQSLASEDLNFGNDIFGDCGFFFGFSDDYIAPEPNTIILIPGA